MKMTHDWWYRLMCFWHTQYSYKESFTNRKSIILVVTSHLFSPHSHRTALVFYFLIVWIIIWQKKKWCVVWFCFSRNIKLTSSLPRRGPTVASDTTAQWKYWLWTATWLDLFGYLTPSSETPRLQIPTGLQCLTSCSGYGTMGRYFIP